MYQQRNLELRKQSLVTRVIGRKKNACNKQTPLPSGNSHTQTPQKYPFSATHPIHIHDRERGIFSASNLRIPNLTFIIIFCIKTLYFIRRGFGTAVSKQKRTHIGKKERERTEFHNSFSTKYISECHFGGI